MSHKVKKKIQSCNYIKKEYSEHQDKQGTTTKKNATLVNIKQSN